MIKPTLIEIVHHVRQTHTPIISQTWCSFDTKKIITWIAATTSHAHEEPKLSLQLFEIGKVLFFLVFQK